MSEGKFQRAIAEALTEDYLLSVPEYAEEHIFSEGFELKMQKLINHQKKPYYRITNTAAKRAVCAAVMIIVASFTTIMSVSAFRNAFKDFFVGIFSEHSEITAADSNDNLPVRIESIYDITYGIDDYEKVIDENFEMYRYVSYMNEGRIINYYQYVKSDFDIGMNTEGAEISTKNINGFEAVFYSDNHNYNNLIWDNGEYVIVISTNIGENELIKIAESVQKVEK